MENNTIEKMELKPDMPSTLGVDAVRIIQEVSASIIVAKKCPRDEIKASEKIIEECKRPQLANKAMYMYPRGGQSISGPSIRLAEVLARHWGNLHYGIRELKQEETSTQYEAYCHDLENNVRSSRVFGQIHERHTKRGIQKLKDPRDIYELVANQATRRLRACILSVIPSNVVDMAIQECKKTLAGNNKEPLQDRAKKMILAFKNLGVTQDMIINKLKHDLDAIDENELLELGQIYNSISQGMGSREQWFEVKKQGAGSMNDLLDTKPPKLDTLTAIQPPKDESSFNELSAKIKACKTPNELLEVKKDFPKDLFEAFEPEELDKLQNLEAMQMKKLIETKKGNNNE